MRILQIHNKVPYPPRDGGSICVWNYTVDSRQGHEVTLLALNTLKHYCDPETIPAEFKKSIRIETVTVDTSVSAFSALKNLLFSKLPYNAVRFIDEAFAKKTEELLSANQYDIVLFEGLYVLPYLPVVKRLSEAVTVYRAHNIEHEIWQRMVKNERSLLKRAYMKVLTRRIRRMELEYLNSTDALLTLTHRDAGILRNLGCRIPAGLAQAGINLSSLRPAPGNEEYPSFYYIGALDWPPNQEALLWFFENCWPGVKKAHPLVPFYIAGRNAPSWLSGRIQTEGARFLGEIDDAYQFMKEKGVMIVPLLSGSGMRIKIIEGMALGKPIVTTSIGTEGISTTHGQDILIGDNPAEFTQHLTRLLTDKNFFDTIGKNASVYITDNYNIESLIKQTTDFFETLKH